MIERGVTFEKRWQISETRWRKKLFVKIWKKKTILRLPKNKWCVTCRNRRKGPSSLCDISCTKHFVCLFACYSFEIQKKKKEGTYPFFNSKKEEERGFNTGTQKVEPGQYDSGSTHWSTTPSKRQQLQEFGFLNFKYYKANTLSSKPQNEC